MQKNSAHYQLRWSDNNILVEGEGPEVVIIIFLDNDRKQHFYFHSILVLKQFIILWMCTLLMKISAVAVLMKLMIQLMVDLVSNLLTMYYTSLDR